MRYAPGQIAELTAMFTDARGELINPTSVVVDIYDANGVKVVEDGIPVNIGLGNYQYDYGIHAEAPQGEWEIFWHAVVNGEPIIGSEDFSVYPASVLVTPGSSQTNTFLRSRLGETKEPEDEDGANTLFRDMEIEEILSVSDDMDAATLEGWRRKAARLAYLVDVSESGASRSLSQRYRGAKSMLDHWEKVLNARSEAAGAALAGRVVGKPMSMRDEAPEASQTPFHWTHNWAYARPYPTKRLLIPAVLG